MRKIDSAVICMTIVCLTLGAIIGIQIKTVRRQTSAFDLQRVNELSVELKKALEENEILSDKLRESRRKIQEYEDSVGSESNQVKILKEELEQIRLAAGLEDMQGRGVTVTLNDSNQSGQNASIDTNAFLVHAEDILSVINELNVAGAEAIEINGQRIVGTSSVRCAGSVVNINGVKIATPFIITAIGDPDVLEASLRFPGGVVDSLSPWGIEVTIKKSQNVVVSGYRQSISFKEATPVEKGER